LLQLATHFGPDVYVASDCNRRGKSTLWKYSTNAMAAAELHTSFIGDLSNTLPILSHKLNLWLELAHVSRYYFDDIKPLGKCDLCRPVLETSTLLNQLN